VDVHLGRSVFGVAVLELVRDAAGELDDVLSRGDLAEAVAEDLAVLGGDDLGRLALARVEQLAEREDDLRAAGDRGVPTRGEASAAAVTAASTVLVGARATRAVTVPVAGLAISPKRESWPSVVCSPLIQWGTVWVAVGMCWPSRRDGCGTDRARCCPLFPS
jgi:hypothetical protein